VVSCSKAQRSTNKLEGTQVISADDPYTTDLTATFESCNIRKNDPCECFWVITRPIGKNYAFDYAVNDEGDMLEMESWSSPTYSDRTYSIVELTRTDMVLRSGDEENYYTYTFVKQ